MRSWQEGIEFRELLLQDEEVNSHLSPDELAAAFNVENFLTHVDFIFDRVFGARS